MKQESPMYLDENGQWQVKDKLLLTPEEMTDIVEGAMDGDSAVSISVNRGHWEDIAPLLLEAQLAHARPIIEKQGYDKGFDDGCVFNIYEAKKQERERIINELEAIDRDADDVRDFTRRVCALIVEYKQALKGEE